MKKIIIALSIAVLTFVNSVSALTATEVQETLNKEFDMDNSVVIKLQESLGDDVSFLRIDSVYDFGVVLDVSNLDKDSKCLVGFDGSVNFSPIVFSNGYAIVQCGDKWGVINDNYEWKLPPVFDDTYPDLSSPHMRFINDIALLEYGDKCFIINSECEIVDIVSTDQYYPIPVNTNTIVCYNRESAYIWHENRKIELELPENHEDIYIEWIVGDIKVCEHKVDDKEDKCTFNTKNLPIGVHKVYAQIGTTVSDYLELTIKDNAAPVITMYEQGEIYYIEVFTNSISTKQEYSEKEKPTAFDDIDGDLTDYITVKGLYDIDYWTVGTYYVIYEVVDQHGHVANNYRTIVIQDTVAPTLTLKEGISEEMYIEYGTYYEVSVDDAIASDEYDNYHGRELTVYMNSNLDIEVIGDYEIIYFAVDSNGLRGFITRTIHIQDHIKPTITLIGEDYMLLEYKEKFRDPGALFQDNYDGEFIIYPSSITFAPKGSSVYSPVDSVDTSLLGIYSLTYSQKDSSENDPVSEARRIVEVKDRTPPVITLLGSNPYILRYGTEYVEPGYKVIDNYDGDITNNSDLVKVRPVIGDTLGTYYVYYNAIDTNGNSTIEVKRTVIILDLVSPIIYFTDVCPQYMTVEALIGEYDTRCDVTGYG